MAWSDAARAAAAEARRRKMNLSSARVVLQDNRSFNVGKDASALKRNPSFDYHSFTIQTDRGFTGKRSFHELHTKKEDYWFKVRKRLMDMAKRISVRQKRKVWLTRIG